MAFKDKMIRFMYGRYGIDQLYYTMLILYVILIIMNIFINSLILGILVWVIFALMVFRSFSRNIYKRRKENDAFLKLWNPVKGWWNLNVRKLKDIKTKRYRKCPNCKAVLRLPKKKGKNIVTCPCCKKDFTVTVRF